MSFGTAFWSAEPDKIWVVLDVLIELHIPFVCDQLLIRASADIMHHISYSATRPDLLLFPTK